MFVGLCRELYYQVSFWTWKSTNGSTVMQTTVQNSSKASVTNNMKSDTTNLVFLYTPSWFLIFRSFRLLVEYTPNTSRQESVDLIENCKSTAAATPTPTRKSAKEALQSVLFSACSQIPSWNSLYLPAKIGILSPKLSFQLYVWFNEEWPAIWEYLKNSNLRLSQSKSYEEKLLDLHRDRFKCIFCVSCLNWDFLHHSTCMQNTGDSWKTSDFIIFT